MLEKSSPTEVPRKELILIGCQNETSKLFHSHLLKTNKYRLIKTNDGEDVVKLAKENLPDFILLDMQLPTIDGFTATKYIREFIPYSRTKIIFLSDFSNFEVRDAAIAVGVNDFLVKPFEFSLLQETLSNGK